MSKLYLQHDYAVTGRDYVDTEGGDTPAGGIDYSTEEQDTGLKWIDGKALYQITVTGNFSGGTFSANTGITEMRPKIVNIGFGRPDNPTPEKTWINDPTYFKYQSVTAGHIIINKNPNDAYGSNNGVIVNILYTKE